MSLMRQFSGAPLADRESHYPIMPPGLLDATNDVSEDLAPFYVEGMHTLGHFAVRGAWKEPPRRGHKVLCRAIGRKGREKNEFP